MSLSNAQLQTRIEVIEESLNTIQVALNKLTTRQQMKALVNIRQAEIDELTQRVADLESQVSILQT